MSVKRSLSGWPCAEGHHRAKLSTNQVKALRSDYLAFVRGYGWLANKYGCSVSTARDIVNFKTRVAG